MTVARRSSFTGNLQISKKKDTKSRYPPLNLYFFESGSCLDGIILCDDDSVKFRNPRAFASSILLNLDGNLARKLDNH